MALYCNLIEAYSIHTLLLIDLLKTTTKFELIISSTLHQLNDKSIIHSIACANKQLASDEQNYTTMEEECLVIVFSVKKSAIIY